MGGSVIRGLTDYVCYWHEVARRQIARQFLSACRPTRHELYSWRRRTSHVLERIKGSGDIFMAWSDEPWIVEGAAVRVSIIAQDDGSKAQRTLDGMPVGVINSDLTSGLDFTNVERLVENRNVSFIGDQKNGSFDIPRASGSRDAGTAHEHQRAP